MHGHYTTLIETQTVHEIVWLATEMKMKVSSHLRKMLSTCMYIYIVFMIDAQSNLLTCRIPTLSGILFPGKPFTTEQCVYTIIPQIMPENQKAHI